MHPPTSRLPPTAHVSGTPMAYAKPLGNDDKELEKGTLRDAINMFGVYGGFDALLQRASDPATDITFKLSLALGLSACDTEFTQECIAKVGARRSEKERGKGLKRERGEELLAHISLFFLAAVHFAVLPARGEPGAGAGGQRAEAGRAENLHAEARFLRSPQGLQGVLNKPISWLCFSETFSVLPPSTQRCLESVMPLQQANKETESIQLETVLKVRLWLAFIGGLLAFVCSPLAASSTLSAQPVAQAAVVQRRHVCAGRPEGHDFRRSLLQQPHGQLEGKGPARLHDTAAAGGLDGPPQHFADAARVRWAGGCCFRESVCGLLIPHSHPASRKPHLAEASCTRAPTWRAWRTSSSS